MFLLLLNLLFVGAFTKHTNFERFKLMVQIFIAYNMLFGGGRLFAPESRQLDATSTKFGFLQNNLLQHRFFNNFLAVKHISCGRADRINDIFCDFPLGTLSCKKTSGCFMKF